MDERVCIIGAGVAGLAAIKSCCEEGLTPICFEQHDTIGGIWNYTDHVRPKQGASVYQSLITNTSKSMMCFSDFPMNETVTPYLTHRDFHKYLLEYCTFYNLSQYIQFCTRVQSAKLTQNACGGKFWLVKFATMDQTTGQLGPSEVKKFAKLIVASGYFVKPHWPDDLLNDIKSFKGECMHSHEYRTPERFANKRIVVIGNANTAGDIAVDASRVAKQVYLSIAKGCWVYPRISRRGTPSDFGNRRIHQLIPVSFKNKLVEDGCNSHIDHVNFGLLADRDPLHAPVMTNDEIALRIAAGRVVIKGRTKLIQENCVMFDDESVVEADVVVCATGYQPDHSFLEGVVVSTEPKDILLYKMVWPLSEDGTRSYAFVGCVQLSSSMIPALELQSRWVARVFAGRCHLPKKLQMGNHVEKNRRDMAQKYNLTKFKFDKIQYEKDLADEINVYPNAISLLTKDYRAAYKVFFGPAFSVHYRISGPNLWRHALEFSKVAEVSTITSTQTRKIKESNAQHTLLLIIRLLIFALGTLIIVSVCFDFDCKDGYSLLCIVEEKVEAFKSSMRFGVKT